MRAALNDAAMVREMEGKVGTLQVECDRLRNEIQNQEEQIRNANARAQASAHAITEVRGAPSIPADVVNKARFFDARLEKEDHLSKSRIIRFLVEQAHRMEETADRMRLLVDSVEPATPRPHPDQTQFGNPESGSYIATGRRDSGR
jgi:cell division septum initiation protein DivIVA